ncbi:hypothetical protein DPQ22_05935 [Candidatus Tokpelaia sp.]|nr:hypothetical protein DPQ22_05935 [Candidatus Tokpelaia sp.]
MPPAALPNEQILPAWPQDLKGLRRKAGFVLFRLPAAGYLRRTPGRALVRGNLRSLLSGCLAKKSKFVQLAVRGRFAARLLSRLSAEPGFMPGFVLAGRVLLCTPGCQCLACRPCLPCLYA